MSHRIVVLGAGYAGAFTAGHLARHLHRDDVQITVVNAETDFVERLRLHQLAAGQELRRLPLADLFDGTGVRLRTARVTAVDPDRRTVTLDDGALDYDTLVYTLGSTIADHGLAGVAEHAHHLATRPAAQRLCERLDALDAGARVLVVGGNLTAIEGATELAESRPDLRVGLAAGGRLGAWLGAPARRHLLRAVTRLDIELHEHARIDRVEPDRAVTDDGTAIAADITVWAAGFAVHPIAAASGLQVESNGQISVDRQMRSVSHPGVYAAGDSAFIIGDNGRPLPMSCASAGFTAMQASAAIVGDLTGRPVAHTALRYVGNHISLGRRDAVFQLVDGAARPRLALRGRLAARVKAAVLNGAAWTIGHPTFALPARRRRLAPSRRAREEVAA